jgi:NAD(P)-dependent dehydrogenase (short-subunit alcohol dehydrogenase family)
VKKSLVIGASRGIGLELVKQLKTKGQEVWASTRSASSLKALEELHAITLQLDVSSESSIEAFKQSLVGEHFDWVVYVAGVYGPRSDAKQEVNTQDFDEVMHTNVLGAMKLIAILAPKVTAQSGKMVFISSQMASMELTDSSSGWIYKASKAALNMCVKAASSSYPDICLLSVSPGWVKTDMGGEFAPLTATQSVQGIFRTIDQATLADTGRFMGHQRESIPF